MCSERWVLFGGPIIVLSWYSASHLNAWSWEVCVQVISTWFSREIGSVHMWPVATCPMSVHVRVCISWTWTRIVVGLCQTPEHQQCVMCTWDPLGSDDDTRSLLTSGNYTIKQTIIGTFWWRPPSFCISFCRVLAHVIKHRVMLPPLLVLAAISEPWTSR